MREPLISVIIPAKNSQATIGKCLDALKRSSYPNYELIVINDGSTDGTAALLAGYPGIVIVNTEGVGPSKARNIGLKSSKGEFIAFTDADCLVAPDWLPALLASFTDKNVAGAGGAQRSPDDDCLFAKTVQGFLSAFGFISGYVKSGRTSAVTEHNPTCNSMYRRQVLEQTGGFLEGLWPGEDVEIDLRIRRMGCQLVFNPAAVVYHYRCPDMKGFCSMMRRYGESQGFLFRKYGFFRPVQTVPFLILLFFLLLPVNPAAGVWAAVLLTIAAFLAAALRSNRPLAVFGLFWTALVYWNIGFLKGLVCKRTC